MGTSSFIVEVRMMCYDYTVSNGSQTPYDASKFIEQISQTAALGRETCKISMIGWARFLIATKLLSLETMK